MADDAENGGADTSPRRIIGYVMGRTPVKPSAAKKLTHINYAFANISDGNEVFLPGLEQFGDEGKMRSETGIVSRISHTR